MAEPAFVQPQAYDAQGNPVAPEVAADAVAKGQAFFQQGAKVYARNARGELVTVDAGDAARPGYRVLGQQELAAEQARLQYGQGAGNVAKAAAAGAARGLTLGASDAVATAIGGDDTRKALEGLRAANPIASGAGEVAGAVAPLVLTGGASAGAQGAGAVARAGQLGAGAVRALGVGNRAIAGVGGIVERGVARGLAALGADGATAAGRIGIAAAKMGARGAAEGALYGAAQAANDAVLKGDAITAEKIVAGMGHGALFGGALGAGLGAVARGTGEVASKLVPKKEALVQLAREQGMKAAGFKGADFRKLAGRATGDAAEKRLAATADDLLDTTLETGPLKGQRVLQPGANVEETLVRISAAKEEAGARLQGLKDEISDAMAASGQAPDLGTYLQRVDDEVIKPLLKSNLPGVRAEARAVEKQLSILRARAAAQGGAMRPAASADDAAGFLKSQPEYKALDDFLGGDHRKASTYWNDGGFEGAAKRVGKEAATKQKQFFDNINTLLARADEAGMAAPGTVYSGRKWTQNKIDDFLQNPRNGIWSTSTSPDQALGFATDNVYGDLRPVMLEIQQRSGVPVSKLQPGGLLQKEEEILLAAERKWEVVGHSVENTADGPITRIKIREALPPDAAPLTFRDLDRFRQDLASRVYPKTPPGGGLPPPPPKGAEQLQKAERLLSEHLKDQAGLTLARLGDNPNAYNEANRKFHSFRQLEQVGTKTANQSLGNRSISPSDHALGLASFLSASATGNVGALGSMAVGGAGALANKLLRERGNSFVAEMARRASQTDSIIESAAASLAGKTEAAKTPVLAAAIEGKSLAERYQQTAEKVRELATPALAHAHVSNLIPEVAAQYPDVGGAVSRKLLAIYQQLSAALPKSHVDTGTTLTPLAIKERVPPVAMRRFLSTVSGTLEPEKVISDLGRGVIDRDAIEAMKLAHPETFMQLRQKVADFVQERQDELPYKRRVMLSMTFDFVGDSSLSPERMSGLQQTAQALTVQDQAQQNAMVKPKGGSRGNSKIGESMKTPNDSIFSGDM